MTRLKQFLKCNSGATAMEYGLTALLISVVAILVMSDSGDEVNNLYTKVEGAVSEAADN